MVAEHYYINTEADNEDYTRSPPCVVKIAMTELSNRINMSTGINHHLDKIRAKTYLRVLHKYERSLDPDIIGAYLIKLGWAAEHAQDVQDLIQKLNNNVPFRGGERTGLKKYYTLWQEKCKQ